MSHFTSESCLFFGKLKATLNQYDYSTCFYTQKLIKMPTYIMYNPFAYCPHVNISHNPHRYAQMATYCTSNSQYIKTLMLGVIPVSQNLPSLSAHPQLHKALRKSISSWTQATCTKRRSLLLTCHHLTLTMK